MQKAFRSAVLVRGARPYALIVDDLRKDDQLHAYDWYMQLEPDVVLEKQDGGDVILRDPKDDGACWCGCCKATDSAGPRWRATHWQATQRPAS